MHGEKIPEDWKVVLPYISIKARVMLWTVESTEE